MNHSSERPNSAAAAFGPNFGPELLSGVRSRRIFACLIDAIAITALSVVGYLAVILLGIITFGLGLPLIFIVWPVVAAAYVGYTLGGSDSATPGMRAVEIEMRQMDGGRIGPARAVCHAILFWMSIVWLTPCVLFISLLSNYKRLLHDMLLGTIVIDSKAINNLA